MPETSLGLWIGFNLFILALLALDLGVFHRKSHTVSLKEAGVWSAVWVALVPRLRRRPLRLPRGGTGARVPHRLPDREVAQRRQHLRLRADLRLLRRAAGLPAPGALLGDPGGAGPAGGLHLRRLGPARPVPLGDLPVRRLPDPHRHPHGPAPRRGDPPRAQSGAPAGAAAAAGDLRLPGGSPLRPRGGTADGDARCSWCCC